MMTPDDFMRALTPGVKQPEGLGLDQFRKYDSKSVADMLDQTLDKDSIFHKLDTAGLISFSDYIFLLTVLSASQREFKIVFNIYDWNGDGTVDCDEFNKVTTLLLNNTATGTRHKDHSITGNIYKGVNSTLGKYFFGPDLKDKLTIDEFLSFQQQLQQEVHSLEFRRIRTNDAGLISEKDFAELLLVYGGFPDHKKTSMLKKVKETFKGEASKGVSQHEYLNLMCFLTNIKDVDMALKYYHDTGSAIDAGILKHLVKSVAGVQLSDNVINVIFALFDENDDGQLSHDEFVSVMKNRRQWGLEKPRDTGFIKFISSMFKTVLGAKSILMNTLWRVKMEVDDEANQQCHCKGCTYRDGEGGKD
ncbi:hypothetical protein Pcinc_009483 [Petrolisthes cinctipes]|uniref:EF-hand domain-containing protein n=1 Tax=Petrolisthes cinctipes TaxID=88211 RepID=A0AAE1G5D2_PETCI|nr:hypothetical protein Pcinc_009483 [Petrolisthes cinctipes]